MTATKDDAQRKEPSAGRQEIGGLDEVLGNRLPRIKFTEEVPVGDPGYTYPMGVWCELVVEDAMPRQAWDFDEEKPATWPSGQALMELVMQGVTTEGGVEAELVISGKRMRDAWRDAMRTAGVKGVAAGDMVRIQWATNEPTQARNGGKAKLNPTKIYVIELIPA